ncbi:unnamed protein product, partial [marine sediment metagenome]
MEIIGEHNLEEKITSLDNVIIPTETNEDVFLVAASKNTITLLRLSKGKVLESNEEMVKIDAHSHPPPILKTEPI